MRILRVAAMSDRQLEVKKGFKELAKKYKMKFKVHTIPAKGEWMRIWRPIGVEVFPAELRNLTIDIMHGKSFKRDRDNPNAGNTRDNMISLPAFRWLLVMGELGIKVDQEILNSIKKK